jgi:hypothetical protein
MIFVAPLSADDGRKSGKFKCTTNSHMHDELMSMSSKDFYDLLNKRDVRKAEMGFSRDGNDFERFGGTKE